MPDEYQQGHVSPLKSTEAMLNASRHYAKVRKVAARLLAEALTQSGLLQEVLARVSKFQTINEPVQKPGESDQEFQNRMEPLFEQILETNKNLVNLDEFQTIPEESREEWLIDRMSEL